MSIWTEIVIAMCGSGVLGGALTAIVQHAIATWQKHHSHEEDPNVKARNIISRHSALEMLKRVHETAVKNGWVSLDTVDEAEEIYNAYKQLGGNGAGTRIMNDLRSMRNYPPTRNN